MSLRFLNARLIPLFLVLFATACGAGSESAASGTELLKGLEWRMVGPWRGGRVTTVTGVPGEPDLYYMGATGGGVWKTENAGVTWDNISDEFFSVGTIGAVAVAASDHNVLYAGTGEAPIRGVTTSQGNGMYKSTDAGKTWAHIGLKQAGQISRIRIHPTNPDVAYIAVQGQIWGPSEERGIYRTTDGGKTWQQVLKVNASTGASDLSMDPSNPRILYAAMWTHGRKPWFILSGSTDGGIFKSTDGGDTWKKLEGGLPAMIGKIGLDIPAANPERIYAIIEAEPEKGGLWRSDDAGETWKLINGHRVLHSRAWYYIHVAADPLDPETVYVMNVPIMKSIDGGKTFARMSAPHGDNHSMWINPEDSKNIINGNDGGATITFDGGATWSSIMNQPTAQFYRVVTDNLTPYRIYGGQQDNSTVGIASQTYSGGIGMEDYYDVGGGESAHIAFDPENPNLIYATSINGTLTEYDHSNRRTRYIIPYPEVFYGKDAKNLKYRTNWNSPVAASPQDPSAIYYGTQFLLKSTDRGANWTAISPDLTRNDAEKQGRNGGPLTPENVGAEFYNTIFYIVESPHEAGTIWVGSDDGLVHVTRDGGADWQNVSPNHPGEALINAIEISPHDPATVYLAVAGYKLNDFKPYIYKTSDYGKSWKRIDKGLPMDSFVRVVREDPAQKGLLYAGTETGMFVSYDDGGHWQSLKLNLPPVPITDLTIRQDNLVAATQGRAFWVLDDLFVVRQSAAGIGGKNLQIFVPAQVTMLDAGGSPDDFESPNPGRGLPIYYYLDDEQKDPISIEILDNSGAVVRTYSSQEGDFERCLKANEDLRSPLELTYPAKAKGLNKWNWDMRRDGLHCIEDVDIFAGFDGPGVPPGDYRARVSAGGISQEAAFTLVPDPRVSATAEQIAAWSATVNETADLMNAVLDRLDEARQARAQIETLMADYPDDASLQKSGAEAVKAITGWDAQLNQPLHETAEDEDAWETMLAGQIRY
ncbi:MAG: WD40/YVTN/BNR-like repeat-containing protein, partial [Lysobacterales bacterium]